MPPRVPHLLAALTSALLLAGCPDSKKCAEGQVECLGRCVELGSDPQNCAVCGHACPTGAACTAGRCECPVGEVECAGDCVATATFESDPLNCGACGVACGAGTCAAGLCACEGLTRCDALTPRCRDLQRDPASCGACGAPCTRPGESCGGGACQCLPPRDSNCTTFCANTQADPANCGGCDQPCPIANQLCDAGSCRCPAGQTVCGVGAAARCVNLQTDEQSCGACGARCPTGATCADGTCPCPTGQDVCGTGAAAACTNLQTDAGSCGTCGAACPSSRTCDAGACVCPDATPVVCGSTCCAGGSCAGDTCPITHSNGLGGSFLACGALGEHTAEQAALAAESWSPSGQTIFSGDPSGPQCGASCLCRTGGGSVAVWCYAGSMVPGRVQITGAISCSIAFCPSGSSPTWN
jgi:hypothetical protein